MNSNIEDIGTDARSADGYVVLFKHNQDHTGVVAKPANCPTGGSLRRLTHAIESSPKLKTHLKGFRVVPRTIGSATVPNVYEVVFAVRNTDDEPITLFLEFARQCRVIENPIVTDMRHFKLR